MLGAFNQGPDIGLRSQHLHVFAGKVTRAGYKQIHILFMFYLSRVFRAQDIHTYHKPYNTLRSILVHPKDRTPTEKKKGMVYDTTCNDCGEHYIGETTRTLEKRLGEHQKQTTSVFREHQSQANHEIDWEGVKILDKESVDIKRKIKEAIHIRRECPTLNRDRGYDLPAIFDNLLSCD